MCTSDSLRCFTVKKKGLKFNVIFKDKLPSRPLGVSFNATMTLNYHSEHFFTRARWLQKDMYTYIGKIVIEELQKWGQRSHPERQYATVEECSALKIRIEREQRKHCAIRIRSLLYSCRTLNIFSPLFVAQEPNSPAGSPPHSPHGNGLDRAPTLRKELPGSSSTGEAPSTPNPRSPTTGKAKDPGQVR